MDIHSNQPGPERAKRAYEQQQRALIDANRARVRAARDDLSAAAQQRLANTEAAREQRSSHTDDVRRTSQRDELEISAAARAASEPSSAEREARIRELAEDHRLERLHTPERIERAAQRLLEG